MLFLINKSVPSPEKDATATFGRTGPDNRYLFLQHLGCLHDGVHAIIREFGHRIVLKIENADVDRVVRVFGLGRYEESRELSVHLIGTVGLQDH